MNKRYWIYLLLAVGVIGYISWTKKAEMPEETPSYMPKWELVDLEGDLLKSDVLEGNVILVSFWASWCGYCRDEQKFLQELNHKYENEGFKIVGISLDQNDSNDVYAVVRQRKLDYLNVMGTGTNVIDQFGGVEGVPTSFLVDRKGRILKKYVGAMPEQEVDGLIKSLL